MSTVLIAKSVPHSNGPIQNTVVWENFSVKKFRTRSGVRKLNTRNIFYNIIKVMK